jgi:hypothetical protein
MKLQKHYLEVSNSFRKEVRAFFRFTAERKNYEFFQTSQKKRLNVGNHFESKSARYALLCKVVGLLFVMILLKRRRLFPVVLAAFSPHFCRV